MNYELELSQSRPYRFNALNGDRPPLVAGSGNATLLTTTPTALAFPIYNESYAQANFSLEVWFLPLSHNKVGEQVVIGHNTEGLLWNGTSFILRIKTKGGKVIEDRWTPLQTQVFHFVVTFDGTRMMLFVNGARNLELGFPEDDTFLAGNGSVVNLHYLNTGVTSTGIYDSAALYTRALSDREVKTHYSWGNDVLSAATIAMLKNGTTWSLTYADVEVQESILITGDRWNEGLIEGLSVVDNLIPDTEEAGTWKMALPLGSIVGTTSAGVHLTYVGVGATLSYSTDGDNWTVVSNKTTILEDVTGEEDMMLFLRIALNDGWVNSLRIDVLADRNMDPLAGTRILTFKSAAMDQTAGNQLDYQSDWGAVLRNGGYIEAQPEVAETIRNTGTIEMWAKIEDSNGFLLGNTGSNYVTIASGSYTFNGVAAYRNGVAVANGTFSRDEWAHWVFVLTTANNNATRIGGNLAGDNMLDMTVGHLALYEERMTAAQVQSLYKQNVGAPALRINDASGITVTEEDPTVSFYAYSWSITSSGR